MYFLGIGTVVNCGAVVLGGVLGLLLRRVLNTRICDTVTQAMGLAVVFIGAAGALSRFQDLRGTAHETTHILLMVLSLALGAAVGEAINIQNLTERFGAFLRRKVKSEKDPQFLEGFVSASLTICVGAMAVMGPLLDALQKDPSTLYTKAVLDLVIILVMAAAMGKGVVFSALPLVALQGALTLLAHWIEPLLTELAVTNISFVGSMLIFCVGLNLMVKTKIRVANLLPALIFTAASSFIPLS